MPERFIFRQVYWKDIEIFLTDGEVRARNHNLPQRCHPTSYPEIANRRGTRAFDIPCGGVVNDYVPFYFSPITSFTYTIHCGNVQLRSPDGKDLGKADAKERVFIICSVSNIINSNLIYCFSNYALNSNAPMPEIKTNLDELESHINWKLFDEYPLIAAIREIGYTGVCRWFQSKATPVKYQYRHQARMAEFLIQNAIPLQYVSCLIVQSDDIQYKLKNMMEKSDWNIPIYVNSGCYFK